MPSMYDAPTGTSTDRSSGDKEASGTHRWDQDVPPKTTAGDSFAEDVRDAAEMWALLTVASPSEAAAVN